MLKQTHLHHDFNENNSRLIFQRGPESAGNTSRELENTRSPEAKKQAEKLKKLEEDHEKLKEKFENEGLEDMAERGLRNSGRKAGELAKSTYESAKDYFSEKKEEGKKAVKEGGEKGTEVKKDAENLYSRSKQEVLNRLAKEKQDLDVKLAKAEQDARTMLKDLDDLTTKGYGDLLEKGMATIDELKNIKDMTAKRAEMLVDKGVSIGIQMPQELVQKFLEGGKDLAQRGSKEVVKYIETVKRLGVDTETYVSQVGDGIKTRSREEINEIYGSLLELGVAVEDLQAAIVNTGDKAVAFLEDAMKNGWKITENTYAQIAEDVGNMKDAELAKLAALAKNLGEQGRGIVEGLVAQGARIAAMGANEALALYDTALGLNIEAREFAQMIGDRVGAWGEEQMAMATNILKEKKSQALVLAQAIVNSGNALLERGEAEVVSILYACEQAGAHTEKVAKEMAEAGGDKAINFLREAKKANYDIPKAYYDSLAKAVKGWSAEQTDELIAFLEETKENAKGLAANAYASAKRRKREVEKEMAKVQKRGREERLGTA